jgi:hypothetical protein
MPFEIFLTPVSFKKRRHRFILCTPFRNETLKNKTLVLFFLSLFRKKKKPFFFLSKKKNLEVPFDLRQDFSWFDRETPESSGRDPKSPESSCSNWRIFKSRRNSLAVTVKRQPLPESSCGNLHSRRQQPYLPLFLVSQRRTAFFCRTSFGSRHFISVFFLSYASNEVCICKRFRLSSSYTFFKTWIFPKITSKSSSI